uniref:Uncharacterized protein n=1 Tax=Ditylenchus dipsaci TaxID=166011 RepID=A0A915DGD5_9BILA
METQDSSFEVITDSTPPLESKVKKQLESRLYLKKEERGEPLNIEDLYMKEMDAANARLRVRSYLAKRAKGPQKPNEEN